MSIKISYIVAVYNVADYIEHCARSLFEQTLEDIEIIFVDDASKDNSVAIIRRTLEDYPQKQGRVKIVVHEENKGTPTTRWDGLCAAAGEFVNFIDGDDYVEPQMGELMYGIAMETGADLVVCNGLRYRSEGALLISLAPQGVEGNGENLRDDTINRRVSPGACYRLIKRSLLLDNDIVWPVSSMADDLVISVMAVYYARKIAHVPVPLYHYTLNPGSISNIHNPEHRARRQYLFVQNNKVLFDFLEREGVTEKYEHGILINKVMAKNEVLPYTNKRKYRRLWLRTYPELNKMMLSGNKKHKSTYREKIWLLSISLGLFPLFRRYLLSKLLRPADEWMQGEYYIKFTRFAKKSVDTNIKTQAIRIIDNIAYCTYMWLWKRPQQLVKLLCHSKYYISPTYYPEYADRRRSCWSRFWNQVGEVLKYGCINEFYFPWGYDVKTAVEQRAYVHYKKFMHRRAVLNRAVEDNCVCILRDKLYFSIFTEGIGLKGANTLFYTLNGELYDFGTKSRTTVDAILNLGDTRLFCKPLDGQCGNGIFLLHVKDRRMEIEERGEGSEMIREEVDANGLKAHCSKGRYIMQTFVSQHPLMNKLHPQSVNTIRLVTVRSLKDGAIRAMPSILRIGAGDSVVDNTSQGGLAVGINMQAGYLKQFGFYKSGFGRKGDDGVIRYKEEEHPDSHVRFAEFQIPYFQEAENQAVYYHSLMPSIHSIGWDIAIGEDGPIFIEGNDNWEITGPQTCNGGLRAEFEEYFFK